MQPSPDGLGSLPSGGDQSPRGRGGGRNWSTDGSEGASDAVAREAHYRHRPRILRPFFPAFASRFQYSGAGSHDEGRPHLARAWLAHGISACEWEKGCARREDVDSPTPQPDPV